MKIETFEIQYLQEAKDALKSAFFRKESDEIFNEWEFAERVLRSEGYLPGLCFIAREKDKIIGYNALTMASIGESKGLALGPLGVRQEYQNQGVGSCLVKESIQRARSAGYPWIVLVGGAYYSRFGFESGQPYGITVSDNPFENAHIQILFLDDKVKNEVSGKLIYCDAFYDERGNLL